MDDNSRPTHKFSFDRKENYFHLIVGLTGSVASIKLVPLLAELKKRFNECGPLLEIRVISTEAAIHFIREDIDSLQGVHLYRDADEWDQWHKRGDPVLHIELRRWANAMVIAPLDANTLAKIANGLCDNLLTCTVRAWEIGKKPLYFAPAMNTEMWNNPLTKIQRDILCTTLCFKEIPPIEKTLMCGDTGSGAMADVETIATIIHLAAKSLIDVSKT